MISTNSKTAKLLIIDDDFANAEMLRSFFEFCDYKQIRIINDPRLAIDAFKSYLPDLILLDLAMPFVSGFEILETLNSLVPEDEYLPVFILTADVTEISNSKALQLGTSEYMLKPVNLKDLLCKVQVHLDRRFSN